MKTKKEKYYVVNTYGAKGSTHRSLTAAIKARDRREGLAWQVENKDGHIFDVDFAGRTIRVY